MLGALLLRRCPAWRPQHGPAPGQGHGPGPGPSARAVPGLSRGSGRAGRWFRRGTAALAGGTAGPPRWFRPLEGKRAPHKRGCPCPAAPGPPRLGPPAPAGSAPRPRGEQPRVAAAGPGSGPFCVKWPGWLRCRGGRGNPFHGERSQGLWPFQKAGVEPSWSWHGPSRRGRHTGLLLWLPLRTWSRKWGTQAAPAELGWCPGAPSPCPARWRAPGCWLQLQSSTGK